MVRLALIGCGSHSRQQHAAPMARYVREHPGEVRLVATCDLDRSRAERCQADFGFERAYTDMDEMIRRERPDACVCIVPVSDIVPLVLHLFDRRMPCVIEKPPGSSPAEVERLTKAARKHAVPHMVSVNRRFVPLLNQGIAWARERGPIVEVRVSLIRNRRREPEFVWSTGIHGIDAARHIAGEVADWGVDVRRVPHLNSVWYVIRMDFVTGCHGIVELLPTGGMVEESYEFFGEGRRVRVVSSVWDSVALQCWQEGALVVEEHSKPDQPPFLNCGAYDETVEFVTALQSGRSPQPDLEAVLPSARIGFEIARRTAGC